MHPGEHAENDPGRPAVIMTNTAIVTTYGAMESSSNALAHLLAERGVHRGQHLAILLDNDPNYFEVVWSALRSGLYVTPINWHLGAQEAGYILEDCEAEVFITSSRFVQAAEQLLPFMSNVHTRLSVDGGIEGFESFDEILANSPATALEHPTAGSIMFYSSGTTGRPKGIKPPLSDEPYGAAGGMDALLAFLYGFTSESRYLVPAPLYHAAPLVWSLAAQRLGATVVVMEQFDPEATLEAIERYQITHAQFVPTHFVRMLKLTEAQRSKYDLSSLQMVVHAAAPCPIEVKKAMMQWWGPIIWEYYAGSEGNGYCSASPEEWLSHPGTVGKSIRGVVHVVGEDGDEVAVGETGQLWFDSGAKFEYHNDAEKTSAAFNAEGWSTLGDVGYLDVDEFVYLTDRISHMIISGGVNIYPQEVENLLVMHPAIADVAVIGVPDEDFGEAVKAVVQLSKGYEGDATMTKEIIAYCQANLAKFKCPRTVDYVDELPRLASGKLLKRQLRQLYWQT